MDRIVTISSIFLVSNLVWGFLIFQWGFPVEGLYNDRPSVPVVMLSFGPPIQLVILWMIYRILKRAPFGKRHFLRLGNVEIEDPASARLWERVSAFFVLGLPLIAFVWAWRPFLKGTVYVSPGFGGAPPKGLFDVVSPTLFLGRWNTYRYGDPLSNEGASFVPFWHPVFIMGLGTVLVITLTFIVVRLKLLRSY